MNREIKFRAWDSENKKMLHIGKFPLYHEKDNGLHSGKENNQGDWYNLPLMQYTGLADKNGSEIFEGDILKSECGKLGKIEWLNNRTAFCVHWYLQLGSGDIEYCVLNMKLEIIGNIFQNPDLLQSS